MSIRVTNISHTCYIRLMLLRIVHLVVSSVMALWHKYVMADNEQGGFTTITVGFSDLG